MAEQQRLSGGELHAAITSALVGIQTQHLGHGPTSASTFHHGNTVVTIMHDALTKAELVLAQNGNRAEVSAMRALYQEELEADFCAAVERLTGRRVLAFLSDHRLEPDAAAQVFILDAPL